MAKQLSIIVIPDNATIVSRKHINFNDKILTFVDGRHRLRLKQSMLQCEPSPDPTMKQLFVTPYPPARRQSALEQSTASPIAVQSSPGMSPTPNTVQLAAARSAQRRSRLASSNQAVRQTAEAGSTPLPHGKVSRRLRFQQNVTKAASASPKLRHRTNNPASAFMTPNTIAAQACSSRAMTLQRQTTEKAPQDTLGPLINQFKLG